MSTSNLRNSAQYYTQDEVSTALVELLVYTPHGPLRWLCHPVAKISYLNIT